MVDEVKTDAELWKRRYQTSCEFYKKSKQKDRAENVIKYLHNDFSTLEDVNQPYLNQFFIALKTLIPMVVAHNPHVAVNPENDYVYEYDEAGNVLLDENGEPLGHNITKVAPTIQGLLKKRTKKPVKLKEEIRNFLRDAIAFNRGYYLVGHTLNTQYTGSHNEPTFHAYIKSVLPHRIKRQAGTKRVDEGTYFFHEYELPYSRLKDPSYKKDLVAKLNKTILEEIEIKDTVEFALADKAGHYDDVQYVKMHDAYDLLTGQILVFGDGVDEPLKVIEPQYSFKNPLTEWIPNALFQPEQAEPVSDLMMGEALVKNAQVIVDKAVEHVKNFNTGYDIERGALLKKQDRKRLVKGLDRSYHIWENQAVSGGKIRPRPDIALGPEPLNMVEWIFGYFQKLIAVYDFQQGGSSGDDETATKTQAKLQTSNFKGGDMSEMFSDACNEALEKYLEVLIKTTDTNEVIKCVGDAGEVEWKTFRKNEAELGQYYCEIDIQSMTKVNEDVKIQQALKLYEIIKTDPDPQIQRKVNKVKLFEIIAKGLNLGNEGVLIKNPDTKGMSEDQYRAYIKNQIIKAKQETQQALAGAQILPPSPDDDDDIHLEDHLAEANKVKSQAAQSLDPMVQQQAQVKVNNLIAHAQIHIDRKKEKQAVEQRVNPGSIPQVQVSNQPPKAGNIAGRAQGGMLQ